MNAALICIYQRHSFCFIPGEAVSRPTDPFPPHPARVRGRGAAARAGSSGGNHAVTTPPSNVPTRHPPVPRPHQHPSASLAVPPRSACTSNLLSICSNLSPPTSKWLTRLLSVRILLKLAHPFPTPAQGNPLLTACSPRRRHGLSQSRLRGPKLPGIPIPIDRWPPDPAHGRKRQR